jgi:hypothetical protein
MPVMRRLPSDGVGDLLEHLAHARAHEGAAPGRRVAIAATDPIGLTRVQRLVHVRMLRRRPVDVNGRRSGILAA